MPRESRDVEWTWLWDAGIGPLIHGKARRRPAALSVGDDELDDDPDFDDEEDDEFDDAFDDEDDFEDDDFDDDLDDDEDELFDDDDEP